MATVEITLIQQPEIFKISLDGVRYNVKKYWNDYAQYWVMDFSDVNNNKLLSGVPLVSGVDILGQFKHLGLTGDLRIISDDGLSVEADYDTIGIKSHLYWTS